jgi:hypothetical protein
MRGEVSDVGEVAVKWDASGVLRSDDRRDGDRTQVRERRRRQRSEYHRWVGTGSGEVLLDASLKVTQHRWIDVELPVEVGTYLAFHLVDFPECEDALTDNTPVPVRI